ncbi:MAG: hypothetical protein RR327_07230 [Clostridia bacterium]
MKLYDEELLLVSNFYLDLNSGGSITQENLQKYKGFLESNYVIPKEIALYKIMQPLNVALKTCDTAKINASVDSIFQVFGGFDKETYKNVLRILLLSKNTSIEEIASDVAKLSDITSSNVYIDVATTRLLLMTAIAKLNYAEIGTFSAKLTALSAKFDDVANKIRWNISDVEI